MNVRIAYIGTHTSAACDEGYIEHYTHSCCGGPCIRSCAAAERVYCFSRHQNLAAFQTPNPPFQTPIHHSRTLNHHSRPPIHHSRPPNCHSRPQIAILYPKSAILTAILSTFGRLYYGWCVAACGSHPEGCVQDIIFQENKHEHKSSNS